jgi:hypothetical protein
MSRTPVDLAHFLYLPITEGNTLVCTGENWKASKGQDNDDDYYEEMSPEGVVVTKYHVYHHMSMYPPFQTKSGWKQFGLDSAVIASGKKD